MPSAQPKRYNVKLSFSDVFKSTKALRQERAALAYKVIRQSINTSPFCLSKTFYANTIQKRLLEEENKRFSALEALVPEESRTTTPPDEAIAQPPPEPNDKAPAADPAKETKGADPAKQENNAPEWTEDQDEQLVRLKSENTPWKAISTAIGKPVGELKTRWNLIRPTTTPNPPKKNEEEKQPEPPESSKPKVRRRVSFTEPLFGASKVSYLIAMQHILIPVIVFFFSKKGSERCITNDS